MLRRVPFGSAAVLGLAILVAFAIRVIPSYDAVMTSAGVNFQDNDSWYHMRVVHNLAANFPHQSGFDPYVVFPGGQNAYTDPWDVAVAGIAWLLAFGRPSEGLVDQVGAWFPAILGALLPIPLFLLAKRVFGVAAARWTAIATAALPGTLLWATHLGVPDHHVAECLLSVCALVFLCKALESERRRRLSTTLISGLLFGIYFCVRPAGIFVPATLTLAVLLEPFLAPFVGASLAIAGGVFFLLSSGSIWEAYTWLALAGSIMVCLLAWALGSFWRKRAWPRAFLLPAVGVAAALAIAIIARLQPAVFGAMAERVSRYLPGSHSVAQSYSVGELIPVWAVPPGGLRALFETLGGVWLPALPVLFCGFIAIWRSRRPVIVLCATWALVMATAGVLQMRMWVYGGPALAVAAGVGCAWLMAGLPRFRTAISLATSAGLLALGISHGVRLVGRDGGPGSDWRQALTWLRRNTPEPLDQANAWRHAWPALASGQKFAYPPSAYGVLTWWDYGNWVNAIAHRMPSTNGTQANADLVAAFLTATSPETAQRVASRLSARYAVLNSELTFDFFGIVAEWARHYPGQFQRVISELGPGGVRVPLKIYLPEYYRTMAVRMYNFDARAIVAGPEVSVFTTKLTRGESGLDFETVVSEQKFPSEKSATEFIRQHPGESMIFGSRDPLVSCVDVEALTQVKRIFTSSEPASLRTVKVFDLKP